MWLLEPSQPGLQQLIRKKKKKNGNTTKELLEVYLQSWTVVSVSNQNLVSIAWFLAITKFIIIEFTAVAYKSKVSSCNCKKVSYLLLTHG